MTLPQCMWIHPGGRTVYVAVNDEAAKIIDVLLVIALQTGDRPARRRRKHA